MTCTKNLKVKTDINNKNIIISKDIKQTQTTKKCLSCTDTTLMLKVGDESIFKCNELNKSINIIILNNIRCSHD